MLFLAHCRSQSSSQKGLRAVHVVTNPIQSTKQVHNSSFILIADCLSFSISLSLSLKSLVRVQFFKLFDRNYLPVGCSVSACCKIHCILNLGLQFLASSENCPPGPWYLSCSPHIPVDCLGKKALLELCSRTLESTAFSG